MLMVYIQAFCLRKSIRQGLSVQIKNGKVPEFIEVREKANIR